MVESIPMLTPTPDDERKEYLNIIIESVLPYDLTSEVIDCLRDIVDKGFHKAYAENQSVIRTLEIKENCKMLGNYLKETAIKSGLPSSSEIDKNIFDTVLRLLCPGLWPFC